VAISIRFKASKAEYILQGLGLSWRMKVSRLTRPFQPRLRDSVQKQIQLADSSALSLNTSHPEQLCRYPETQLENILR
jgi:hypothetical protein